LHALIISGSIKDSLQTRVISSHLEQLLTNVNLLTTTAACDLLSFIRTQGVNLVSTVSFIVTIQILEVVSSVLVVKVKLLTDFVRYNSVQVFDNSVWSLKSG
jgi:hypothetical protein